VRVGGGIEKRVAAAAGGQATQATSSVAECNVFFHCMLNACMLPAELMRQSVALAGFRQVSGAVGSG